ncbi:MAG: hypothetical protein CMA06_02485 [Euryarchaeota archaeon]|nr:hypothetical protein [Euryarchaeota archaeon]
MGADSPGGPLAASAASREDNGSTMTLPASPASPAAPASPPAHRPLATAAAAAGGTKSECTAERSVHTLASTVSFAQLKTLLKAAGDRVHSLLLGSVDGDLVLTLPLDGATPPPPPPASKKRRRDAQAEEVELSVHKLRQAKVSDALLATAERAILSVLQLRDAQEPDEEVVDAWGLSAATQEEASTRPKLILAARIKPFHAVWLKRLKQALGDDCFADGLITTDPSMASHLELALPTTPATRLAEAEGQKSIILFATVSERPPP